MRTITPDLILTINPTSRGEKRMLCWIRDTLRKPVDRITRESALWNPQINRNRSEKAWGKRNRRSTNTRYRKYKKKRDLNLHEIKRNRQINISEDLEEAADDSKRKEGLVRADYYQ